MDSYLGDCSGGMMDAQLLKAILGFFPELVQQSPGGQIEVVVPDDHPRVQELLAAFYYLAEHPGSDGVKVFVEMLGDVVVDRVGFDRELRRIGLAQPFGPACPEAALRVDSKTGEWLENAVADGFRHAKIARTNSSSGCNPGANNHEEN